MPGNKPGRGQRAKTSKQKTDRKISDKISKLRGEGKSQAQSIAQAINTVAPERSKKRKNNNKKRSTMLSGAKFT